LLSTQLITKVKFRKMSNELFNYLYNELDIIPLESNLQEIREIVLRTNREEVLTALSQEVNGGNVKKGFWEDYEKVKEDKVLEPVVITKNIMLVVTELAEAVEALRENNRVKIADLVEFSKWRGGSFKTSFKENIKDKFEDEIADSIIRLLDICGGLGIDIGFFVKMKLKYNSTRGAKHGKKF